MAEPIQRPQTSSSAFQRMLDNKKQFYSSVGKIDDETIIFIGKNPKKAFRIGLVGLGFGLGFAFYGGLRTERSIHSAEVTDNAYSTVKLIQSQNIAISGSITELVKNEEYLAKSVQEIKVAQVELKNEFNDMKMQKSAEQRPVHVEQVQPKKSKHWWHFWK